MWRKAARLQINHHADSVPCMDSPACIRLPFLHPRGRAAPFAYYLSPGHAKPETCAWQPDDFPLAPQEASEFLASLRRLTMDELETMRLAARRDAISDQITETCEIAAIAEFRGRKNRTDGIASARLLAQRLLLWRWFWEECHEEIAALVSACTESERLLPTHFQEDASQGESPAKVIEDAREPDALWRPVAANAAFFLPVSTAILAEGEMAEALREELPFTSADSRFAPDANLVMARAPLWRALGHSRPATGLAAAIYNEDRTWLVGSAK